MCIQLHWCKTQVSIHRYCTLVQALRLCTGRTAQRVGTGIALLFLEHVTRRGEGSESRPGRFLPPGKTRYPFYRRLGGPHGRSGQVRKISLPPGFDSRTVQPAASHYTNYSTQPKSSSLKLNILSKLRVFKILHTDTLPSLGKISKAQIYFPIEHLFLLKK